MNKYIVIILMVTLTWAMAAGASADPPANAQSPFFDSVNAFKIPSLWGVRRTAPYFHDNSAKTLEAVAAHYAKFFALVSTPPGGGDPALVLTEQDQADIVAYMKLLD